MPACVGSVALFSGMVNLLMLAGPLYMLQIYDRVLSSRLKKIAQPCGFARVVERLPRIDPFAPYRARYGNDMLAP